MLLHSPLKRWKLEEYGYHWGAGPAISPAQIFTHTHMNQGASREVCVTMKVRERERVWTKSNMTHRQMKPESRNILCLHSRCWCCRKYQFTLQPLKHATRSDAGIQGGMDGAFLLSSSFLPDAPQPVQTCCCVARLPLMENVREAASLSRFQTRTHARRTGLY